MINQQLIRNFSIVAHIDHGKSTLADRLIEYCGAISQRDMKAQVLDSLDLERERGITIKASAVTLSYPADDGQVYMLNLIDTPGHVDFAYEVSRALHACEGAVLLADVSQGVEAQTVANAYLAVDQGLELIPVVSKIDLENFDRARAATELEEAFGFVPKEIVYTSGKTGEGVHELLEAIVHCIPPPQGDPQAPLQALIFDAKFDPHRGVIVCIRVFEGTVQPGDKIMMMSSGKAFQVQEVGLLHPEMRPTEGLQAGQVGYLTAAIKGVTDSRSGDTITHADRPAQAALPGYREVQPMVFAGLYPADSADYGDLKDAIDRFALNDPSFSFAPETSAALGFGFRCGFLGLLHMEIVQERLEREYNLNLVTTAPSVRYRLTLTDGQIIEVENPAKFPEPQYISVVEEPVIAAEITVPHKYVGPTMELSEQRRGEFVKTEYLDGERAKIHYRLPLSEVIVDFFDDLKSVSRGYAVLDYEPAGYQASDLVNVDVFINMEVVDALSFICHRSLAERRGRDVLVKLRKEIPKQLFEVRLQAGLGKRVIASEKIAPLRKDVLEKCYGGDITRKRKLLEKQKEGKKRMKQIGRVEVPQEAFMAVLKRD
jgi:GTP-binding protein LepA